MDELKDKSQNKIWLIAGIIIIIFLVILLLGRFDGEEAPAPELTEPAPFPPASGTNKLPPGFGGGPSQVINPFTGEPVETR